MEGEKVLVKLYELDDENNWVDKHTGFLFFYIFENDDDSPPRYRFVICEDQNAETVLSEFDLEANISYELQQDTLISWKEDDNEYALSFNDADNCRITYETIQKSLKTLGVDESNEKTEIEVPELNGENIRDFSLIYNELAKKPAILNLIETADFLRNLTKLFKAFEETQNIEGLNDIYNIIRSMLLYSRFNFYDTLLSDEFLNDIVGMLEYNPNLERIEHRKILENSKFVELFPFSNNVLKNLIVHTHTLQYLSDIIMPSPIVFEDRATYITSYLHFRKTEIVENIFEDTRFLSAMFKVLSSSQTTDNQKFNILKLLNEICVYSKYLQNDQKKSFLEKLISFDIFACLNELISNSENVDFYIIEILFKLTESNPESIRSYFFNHNYQNFWQYLCNKVHQNTGSIINILSAQIINFLLDTSNTDDTDFLYNFYDKYIDYLVSPLGACADFLQSLTDENILDLLISCFTYHNTFIKSYIYKTNLLLKIANLVNSPHAFLAHRSIKIVRLSITFNEKAFNKYFCEFKILDIYFDRLLADKIYNLVNSSLIELFEFLRVSGNRNICYDFIERRKAEFSKIDYIDTFRKLLSNFEQNSKFNVYKLNSSFAINSIELFPNIKKPALNEDDRENLWFSRDDIENHMAEKCDESEESWDELPPLKPKFENLDDNITLRPVINKNGLQLCLKRSLNDEQCKLNAKLVDYSDDEDLPPPPDEFLQDSLSPNNKKTKIV